ncbi:GTPase-associated system all-helical protein GASH [Archangium sp.]|uniref:GTPase-associated system all-helical protein GASH n=1 Tax=Archangium sp. TaxID=1872627 RepID=UPI00286BD633|nr:GTPase-associated system all-helical protein GASH [Archangium sp.]
MATNDSEQLAERFREFCQEWDLSSGVAEIQAQNTALVPLHAWLLTGMNTPEVVIRAVQVLMADPERPATRKRPALKQVFKQVSQAWGNAGLNEQDVHILRGMLLAAWPRERTDGAARLVSLLDSAWIAIESRLTKEKRLIEDWRRQQLAYTEVASSHQPQKTPSSADSFVEELQPIDVGDIEQTLGTMERLHEDYTDTLAKYSANLFRAHQDTLIRVTTHLDRTNLLLKQFGSTLANIPTLVSGTLRKSIASQIDLLWWGQARYSSIKRRSYRRISDATERLWWMTWESSDLAMPLAVEPATAFLIETLYQLDNRSDAPKRPLKEWLAEFIGSLRQIHEHGQHVSAITMSKRLETLAREDALGLPVTWARLQAANPKPFEGSLEERIRTDISVDPDTLLDLGDWAAWVFREALLDRHLEEFGEQ